MYNKGSLIQKAYLNEDVTLPFLNCLQYIIEEG